MHEFYKYSYPKPKMNRKLKYSIILIILALLFFYNWPFRLEKEMMAIEIKLDDPSYLEEVSIHLDGYYKFNLITYDHFVGKINLSNYPLTNMHMFALDHYDRGGGDVAFYIDGDPADCRDYSWFSPPINVSSAYTFEPYYLGRSRFTPLVTEICYNIYEQDGFDDPHQAKLPIKHWYGHPTKLQNYYYIVSGVSTREQAIKKLIKWGILHNDLSTID